MDTNLVVNVLTALVWLAGYALAFGTALSWLPLSHWFIRGWDFPRLQIAILSGFLLGIHLIFFHDGHWADWLFVVASAVTIGWQFYRIGPYLPIASRQVIDAENPKPDRCIRMLATNVQMENKQHHRLLETIHRTDPDLVLALEVDKAWEQAFEGIKRDYPHVLAQPQDNMYGMMLLSRFELVDPEVRFIVQEDIPSIHTGIRLGDGTMVTLHGLHPRPPEPFRDQPSTPRDAELVIVAREIAEEDGPVIVLGDLNDVCWSRTTLLFMRLSRLLDPRHGRGIYNTFDANSYWQRVPLDHVFHSPDFKLVQLQVQPAVGSDHFPVLIELEYHPPAEAVQKPPREFKKDQELADFMIKREEKAHANGDDRPDDDDDHEDTPNAPKRANV